MAQQYVRLRDRLNAGEVDEQWQILLAYRNLSIGAAGGVLVLGNVIQWRAWRSSATQTPRRFARFPNRSAILTPTKLAGIARSAPAP
jgi:hypothetical protein